MSDDSTSTGVGDLFGGENLPVVVGIVVRVTSDLLTYSSALDSGELTHLAN